MSIADRFTSPRIHIFYGWWLVAITVFTLTSIITPIFQGLGFFFVALEQQFGWSRAVLSVPFSLSRIEGALLGPIEGWLVDRLGSRRMILFGFLVLGFGFISFSFIDGVAGYYISFLLIFAGAGFGGFMPLIAAINNWFRRHRAKAMALGLLGINLGALLAPLMGHAMDLYGWRAISLWLGIGVWLFTIPIALSVRNRPEDYGQMPDGDSIENATEIESDGSVQGEIDFTWQQAMRTMAFWTISGAHGFSAVSSIVISVHIVPAMTDIGMSLAQAGTVVLTYGLAGGISQLIGGFLGDKWPKRPLIALIISIQATGMIVAALIHTNSGAYLFAVLYGIGIGGRVPLLTAIRGDYFGRKNFATIMGFSQLPMNLGMVGAPVLAGYFFDVTGSYMIPFLGLAICNLVGALLIMLTPKPTLNLNQQSDLTTA